MKNIKIFFEIDFTIYLFSFIAIALVVQFSTGKAYSPEQAKDIANLKISTWLIPLSFLIFRTAYLGVKWCIKKIQTRRAEAQ